MLAAILADGEHPEEALRLLGRMKIADDEPTWVMPGLVVLCTARCHKLEVEARDTNLKVASVIALDGFDRRDNFQMALYCLGMDEFVRRGIADEVSEIPWVRTGAAYLIRAYQAFDPLCLGLPLWPILSSFHDTPEFQAVMTQRKSDLSEGSGDHEV